MSPPVPPSWRRTRGNQWLNLAQPVCVPDAADESANIKIFMKPTPQISSNETTQTRLPVTDYDFQSTLETTHAVAEHDAEVRETRAFWKMSAEVFGPKTTSDYVRELVAFGAIASLAAWPIFAALHAITRMVRGY